MHPLSPIKQERPSPVRQDAYEALREAILDGRLPAGERLVEREIAERLGVSRTPVREAIRKLELERLVAHVPRKGVVVRGISTAEALEIFTIRAALEGVAAGLAAERADARAGERLRSLCEQMEEALRNGDRPRFEKAHDRFNDTVYRLAGSPRLYDMINSLRDYIARFSRVTYGVPGRTESANREHRELAEAIAAGDRERAAAVARLHIEGSRAAFEEAAGAAAAER